jgi:Na+-translocating ferredoxin:NAD+ oxidoreductase RnfC subunit
MHNQSKSVNFGKIDSSSGRVKRIEDLGIVGCGGAGFPAAIKLQANVPLVIVNAAECEPLLHKDKELMLHSSELMLRGLRIVMEHVGAERALVGIKEKYKEVIAAIEPQLHANYANVDIHRLKDCYPAGDEFVLVYDVTGRVIPPGGLPRDVGCVVFNVETLVNIGLDQPVTHKYLTVAGAVNTPVTLRVPIGMAIGEVIDAAGGTRIPDFHVLLGGIMMARLAAGLDEPVTKTTGGIVVLPSSHYLIGWHRNSWKRIERSAKSACDQCRYCTEFCPRYLLGHPMQPHRAMSAIGFSGSKTPQVAGVLSCCECNLCSLYACPESLDPKNVCVAAKPAAREMKMHWSGEPGSLRAHPLNRERRVPMRRLMTRLGLNSYNNVGPLTELSLDPGRVVMPLKQHAGPPASPAVRPGDHVRAGDLIAAPAPGELGARIHASIDGIVRSVNGAVIIEGGK